MLHLECSNDRRRITLPIVILRPEPVTNLEGYRAMALLDTGATTTGITPRVADALGLLSLGKRPLGSAQGDGQADRYLFRVGLTLLLRSTAPARAIPIYSMQPWALA